MKTLHWPYCAHLDFVHLQIYMCNYHKMKWIIKWNEYQYFSTIICRSLFIFKESILIGFILIPYLYVLVSPNKELICPFCRIPRIHHWISWHYKFRSIGFMIMNSKDASIRPNKKKKTDRKMRKNRVGFFFFFLCQIWAKNLLKFVFNGFKKHLHDLYMRFDCIPPEFSPFRNFKKNIGKLNSLTVRKKKKVKKKIQTDRPNFQILVGWGQHNNFFLGLIQTSTSLKPCTSQYNFTFCTI